MRAIAHTSALALALILGTAGGAQAAEAGSGAIIIQPVRANQGIDFPNFTYGNFDNLRFGLNDLADSRSAALFGGRNAVSLGFDYNLGSGLAIAFDSINTFKAYDEASYFLSNNPLQLKYRLGLPFGAPATFMPFATGGAGLTVMGLFGDPSGKVLGGVGLTASAGIGAVLADAFTLELGFSGSRVSAIDTYGMQFRIGTPFDSLGKLPGFGRAAAGGGNARPGKVAPAAAPAGTVVDVVGDRLSLSLPVTMPVQVGDDMLIYFQDDITVKVARARIETLSPTGQATARVIQATEPIKRGYFVRGW